MVAGIFPWWWFVFWSKASSYQRGHGWSFRLLLQPGDARLPYPCSMTCGMEVMQGKVVSTPAFYCHRCTAPQYRLHIDESMQSIRQAVQTAVLITFPLTPNSGGISRWQDMTQSTSITLILGRTSRSKSVVVMPMPPRSTLASSHHVQPPRNHIEQSYNTPRTSTSMCYR